MWYYRVTMSKANAHVAMLNDFAQRQTGGIHIVIALDNVQFWGDLSQVVIRFLVFQITQAYNLSNLSGGQKLSELFQR